VTGVRREREGLRRDRGVGSLSSHTSSPGPFVRPETKSDSRIVLHVSSEWRGVRWRGIKPHIRVSTWPRLLTHPAARPHIS
jgi:hypothetical protein